MNKRQTFNDLLMKITSCNTQHELKEIIKDINRFIEDYSIYGVYSSYDKAAEKIPPKYKETSKGVFRESNNPFFPYYIEEWNLDE